MAGHAQLKFVMTECSKTQIRLTGLIYIFINNNMMKHEQGDKYLLTWQLHFQREKLVTTRIGTCLRLVEVTGVPDPIPFSITVSASECIYKCNLGVYKTLAFSLGSGLQAL